MRRSCHKYRLLCYSSVSQKSHTGWFMMVTLSCARCVHLSRSFNFISDRSIFQMCFIHGSQCSEFQITSGNEICPDRSECTDECFAGIMTEIYNPYIAYEQSETSNIIKRKIREARCPLFFSTDRSKNPNQSRTSFDNVIRCYSMKFRLLFGFRSEN